MGRGAGGAPTCGVRATARRRRMLAALIATAAFVGAPPASARDSRVSEREEILFEIPSLYEGNRGSYAAPSVHGATMQTYFPTGDESLVVVTDGIPLLRSTGALGPLFDLESVDVLPGPQGTRGGKQTTGGWIDLRSRAPHGERELFADYQVGTYDQHRWRAIWNEPLVEDALMLRASAQIEDRDGFQRPLDRIFVQRTSPFSVDSRPSRASDSWGDANDVLARLQLRALPIDGFELLALGQYVRHRGNGPALALVNFPIAETGLGCAVGLDGCGLGANRFPRTAVDVRRSYRDFAGSEDVDRWIASLTATYRVDERTLPLTNGLELRAQGGVSRVDVGLWTDGDLTDAAAVIEGMRESSGQATLDVSLGSAAARPFEWSLGAVGWLGEARLDGRLVSPPFFGFNSLRESVRLEETALAFYANAGLWVFDVWHLGVGIRYSDEEHEYRTRSAVPAALIPPIGYSARERSTTYEASLAWQPSDVATFALRYATAARPGSYSTPGGCALSSSCFGEPSETARHVELSMRIEAFENRIELDSTGFFTNFDDHRVCIDSGFAHDCSEDGNARAYGVDAAIRLFPFEGALIQATVAYLHTELGKLYLADPAEPPFLPFSTIPNPRYGPRDLSGRRFARAPQWQVGALARYEVDLAHLGFDGFGSLTPWFEVVHRSRTEFRIFPAYSEQVATTLASVGLGWASESKRWQIESFINNVGDEDVVAIVRGSYRGALSRADYSPRTAGIRLAFAYP